jgi:uncharacterized protein (DUF1800 family)
VHLFRLLGVYLTRQEAALASDTSLRGEGMRKTLVLLAACVVVLPPQRTSSAEPDYTQFEKQTSADQAILHALNRLSFGPRPGDVDTVKKMGLKKWINLQLHPDDIPENEALAKLVEPLVEPTSLQLPAPGALKAGTFVIATANGVVTLTTGGSQQQLQQLISPAQINVLRTGSDKEGLEILAALPSETVVQVLAGMPAVRPRLLPFLDADLRKKVEAAAPAPAQPGDTLAQAKLYRAIQSERQLEEVLVDFWYNHFNVDASKGIARYVLNNYELEAIRPHVLGKFRDLLEATANSPAMMFYLDNWQSSVAPATDSSSPVRAGQTARGLNENYARELMELHTLGVNGGYTQRDIVEVARCFTGWTLDNANAGGVGGLIRFTPNSNLSASFVYSDEMHDKGEKVVLGVTIPAGGGKNDGEKVLDILARHPSTAQFISWELAQRFVADDPPPALVSRMAQTFRETDGDIRAVLTTLFNSKEFFSQGAYRAKLKTPLEMVVSSVRATGAKVDNAAPLVKEIASLGQPLYRKLEPIGYSNRGTDWASSASLLERMNFSLQLGQNEVEGVTLDPQTLSSVPATAARQLLFTDPDTLTVKAIGDAVFDQTDPEQKAPSGLIAGIVIGSPDFQRK